MFGKSKCSDKVPEAVREDAGYFYAVCMIYFGQEKEK
jgi:hypothetical protein